MVTIYHNPRCRKSREALQWIQEKGLTPRVVEYLKDPLTETQLADLLGRLGMEAESLIRKNEAIWKEQFRGKNLDNQALIRTMVAHPKLMERPIVVSAQGAVVARPASKISEILDL